MQRLLGLLPISVFLGGQRLVQRLHDSHADKMRCSRMGRTSIEKETLLKRLAFRSRATGLYH